MFSHDLKGPCQIVSFKRDLMKIDRFQIYSKQNNAYPGVEGDVIHRDDSQPIGDRDEGWMENKIGYYQHNKEQQREPGSFDK